MALSSTLAPSSTTRRWWQRLTGASSSSGLLQLPDTWRVVELAHGDRFAVGPGGAFLLATVGPGRGAVEVARSASQLACRLTARLGRSVVVHGVLVVGPERAQPVDQPRGATIVSERVLGAWLASHPNVVAEHNVRLLAAAAGPAA